jgi:hypothetical protein
VTLPVAVYRPRNPQSSDYYRCVENYFETFLGIYDEDADQVKEDAKYIKDVQVVEIPTMHGHMGASSTYSPGDVDFNNRIVRELLDDVTNFGKKIQ